jgi:hypothetical protein
MYFIELNKNYKLQIKIEKKNNKIIFFTFLLSRIRIYS